jgi:hypothetical protein
MEIGCGSTGSRLRFLLSQGQAKNENETYPHKIVAA